MRCPAGGYPDTLGLMGRTGDNELVKVTDGNRELDGIVFDAPSRTKVTVAVMDPARGPQLRTVHPDALTERTEAGPDDRALALLIRRTWRPSRGGSAPGGAAATRGQDGHTRAAGHRTTGR
jgi:hypothetical protein